MDPEATTLLIPLSAIRAIWLLEYLQMNTVGTVKRLSPCHKHDYHLFFDSCQRGSWLDLHRLDMKNVCSTEISLRRLTCKPSISLCTLTEMFAPSISNIMAQINSLNLILSASNSPFLKQNSLRAITVTLSSYGALPTGPQHHSSTLC